MDHLLYSTVKYGALPANALRAFHRLLERRESIASCSAIVILPSLTAVMMPTRSSTTSIAIATNTPNTSGKSTVTLAISPFNETLLTFWCRKRSFRRIRIQ